MAFTGHSPFVVLREAGHAHLHHALFFVHPFVEADLTNHIGHHRKVAVVLLEIDLERLRFQLRMFPSEQHVLGFGMVLKFDVQAVAPGGLDDVQQPGNLIVEERDHLRDDPVQKEHLRNVLAMNPLFQDEQVPLLVVLLMPRLLYAVEDPPGEVTILVAVRDRDVGDVLPSLIGHAGDDLQHLELAPASFAAIEQVHDHEQDLGQEAVLDGGRGQGFVLLHAQLLSTESRHSICSLSPYHRSRLQLSSASPIVQTAAPSKARSLSKNWPGATDRAGNPPRLASHTGGVDTMKLKVPRKSTAARALPAADTEADIGRVAISKAMAISKTPSQLENVWTLNIRYSQLINGLFATSGWMAFAS